MKTLEEKCYTCEEYLAFEEKEGRRYDFRDCQVMDAKFYEETIEIETGASEQHQIICSNLIIELDRLFRETNCRVMPSGIRVQAGKLDTYPDIVVVCGESRYREPKTNTGRDTLTNPIVLIEVLSESTRDRDRGEKFQAYRTIPTLQDFIAIEQDSVFVEHFTKLKEGKWLLCEYSRREFLA
ncbi:MAG: Uma2 family endonuclease [Chloroherpetonaceae bacterium]|nr:Uma2 family endonuclease [Chloroherpetonaceae bacterium]MCS7210971.1 Uma2 family endonuclease [Chloroherpetonaceae bacterium]MDW8019120.1 Uma2 family endonuclease [Chloroherpetonaceae bacterium]